MAAEAGSGSPVVGGPEIVGIPIEFLLFGATLAGVAVFHHRTFSVAAAGLLTIIAYKYFFTGFPSGPGLSGLLDHLWHERIIISNLILLLLGFAVLARHFEDSKAPDAIPRILPDNWLGGLTLLGMIFILSGFLDNIAAALIGGVVAKHVFEKVHIGYLAAIVASSNAGGAGSVVGDTTTTMMWIDGVSPLEVLPAYVAAATAFVVFAVPLSLVQQRYSPICAHCADDLKVDWTRVGVVAFILAAAISANAGANIFAPHLLGIYPVIGLAVWAAILVAAVVRRPNLGVAATSLKGTLFLMSLVLCASLMPVEKLPPPSWQSALGLGFVSSVFDNIPLTALALKQGGYDWGALAFCVGFGGSMVWFGSTAGVAISNLYPEAKSVFRWVRHGWWIALGYVVGFFVMLNVLGWHPAEPHKSAAPAEATTH
ncbi:MAG: citrate transporter [Parvularculaceae bacterium]|nr:citrate transporter [Parvularculaceae bacterium]